MLLAFKPKMLMDIKKKKVFHDPFSFLPLVYFCPIITTEGIISANVISCNFKSDDQGKNFEYKYGSLTGHTCYRKCKKNVNLIFTPPNIEG